MTVSRAKRMWQRTLLAEEWMNSTVDWGRVWKFPVERSEEEGKKKDEEEKKTGSCFALFQRREKRENERSNVSSNMRGSCLWNQDCPVTWSPKFISWFIYKYTSCFTSCNWDCILPSFLSSSLLWLLPSTSLLFMKFKSLSSLPSSRHRNSDHLYTCISKEESSCSSSPLFSHSVNLDIPFVCRVN